MVSMDEGRIFEIESNSRCSKYKEVACMTGLTKSFSQPTTEISLIWIPLISNKVTNRKGSL
jgi:hypothetical protein